MAKMSKLFHDSNQFNLTVLTLSTPKHPFYEKVFKNNLPNSEVEHVFINTNLSPLSALKALATNKSYHLSRFKSTDFNKKLIELLKKKTFQFVIVESIFVGLYADTIKKYSSAKIIYNAPNIEWEIWVRLASETKASLKKSYLKILAKQLKKEEIKICNKFDGIIALTQKDEKAFNVIAPSITSITIPFKINLANYPVSTKSTDTPLHFYHLGAMDWIPNVNGINWFLNEVWNPHFITNQAVKLHLAGKGMPQQMFSYNKGNVSIEGFVDNTLAYINTKDVLVAPLFSGSGMRIKILEAMALGKCVLGTSIAFEGIDISGKTAIVANTKEAFIEQIKRLNEHPEIIKEIGLEARKLVEEKYNQLTLESEVTKFFESLA